MTRTVDGKWLVVPAARALESGQTTTFSFESQGQRQQGFILRKGDALFAYANRCPHWNVDLDLGDERFYDGAIDRIYCKNHGATFVPEDGSCDFGPCFGRALERFEIREDTDGIKVEISKVDASR
ncbi:MAG: Rieske 2Fe-2S domain-containing protein [Polyangiaceae bacterium]